LANSPFSTGLKKVFLTCFFCLYGTFNSFASEPISPLIPTANLNIHKFELGKRLFKDTRLSGNKVTSCHTCHDLNKGGDDGLAIAPKQTFNSPTIYNASKNYTIGWLGSFTSSKQHLESILANKNIMGTNWPFTIKALKEDEHYRRAFDRLYQNDINQENIIDALSYFETNLIEPSKFDQFLMGDLKAISPAAIVGYETFKDYGCISCHQGVNVGGNIFQTLGVFQTYTGIDGHYQTKKLRVPSLRNVTRTAPYLHDGSIDSLSQTIKVMAEHQLGQSLTDLEVSQIIAFLESLNSINGIVNDETN